MGRTPSPGEDATADFPTGEDGLHREALAKARVLVATRYPLGVSCAAVQASIAALEDRHERVGPTDIVFLTAPQKGDEREPYHVSVSTFSHLVYSLHCSTSVLLYNARLTSTITFI